FPARLPWGSAAACAGVDDAAGGAIFAGVSRAEGETCVPGGVQNAGTGSGGFAAAVSKVGGRCDYRVLGHFDCGGSDGAAVGAGRCGAEFAESGSNGERCCEAEAV